MPTALELIEKQTGRLYKVEDWHAATAKVKTAPETLTDTDLAIIEHFGGEKDALEARYARSGLRRPGATRGTSTPAQGTKPVTKRTPILTIEKDNLKFFSDLKKLLERASDDELVTEPPELLTEKDIDQLCFFSKDRAAGVQWIAYLLCHLQLMTRKNCVRNKRIIDLENKLALLQVRLDDLTATRAHSESENNDVINRNFDDVMRRLKTVEERGLEYRGIWATNTDYRRGDVVTHNGSMWVCKEATRLGKPGSPLEGGRAWQLAVKGR